MPARAFCSDESQGCPVIPMTQHSGTFPSGHGKVGGRVASIGTCPAPIAVTILVIVQACHAGFDAGDWDAREGGSTPTAAGCSC